MSTAKLDFVREYEKEIQKQWKDNKTFEVDAPVDKTNVEEPKYMASFPYPYMNGRLHIGHVFTVTKAEFMCQFQRLKGKRVLFPFAFHCTGMPIKVCADKLKKEMEEFGTPPVFPIDEPEKVVEKVAIKEDPLQFKSNKSKVKAKTGGIARQWKIMQSLGITDEEIPKFADTTYWLNYFPPHCKGDLESIGMGIDWRRSFITTDVNQYYDSFVRWQFTALREQDKVKFGERYSIWSTTDNQQCADHERSQGEGVQPQNYTLIKLEVVEPAPAVLAPIMAAGKKVYLVPGTLRPETMYGQTNCWVLPTGKYGAFEMKDGSVFVCTERSVRNMAYQGLTKVRGQFDKLAEFTGQDLIGASLKAPLAINPIVHVLPMLSIDENKGTGVVTSVPSDSPDDYATLVDLKLKEPLRKKFGVKDEWVLPFEVISIIDIPGYTETEACAVRAYREFQVKSQNDRDLLDKAKDLCYQKGFNDGVMAVGPYKGEKVSVVKKTIKDEMVASGQAVNYSEPAGKVVSRSGDECVVALTDQWYINYGEEDEQWRQSVLKNLATMELFSPETRKRFEIALGWLGQWACSRSFGLGTKLPWAQEFLIESLSDSTIYMAFYTIAHILQSDFNGQVQGSGKIAPPQMSKEVWDYVLLNGDLEKAHSTSQIAKDTLTLMKREFNYWYPLDLRVSGIDLVQNHLTFFLYNHATLFPEHHQPRGIRANGFVLLNGEKMSKSSGNFLTLFDAVEKYSADATRVALADAGDGVEDANFLDKTALSALFKLHTQVTWVEEMLLAQDKMYTGAPTRAQDIVFASEINRAIKQAEDAYEKSQFREALRIVFFDFLASRDYYKSVLDSVENMSKELINRFIEVQAILMYPIAPHFSQKIFNLIGKGDITNARWPLATDVDVMALRQNDYLKSTAYDVRTKINIFLKSKNKGGKTDAKAEKAVIYISKTYPKWKIHTLDYLSKIYDAENKCFTKETATILEDLKKEDELKSQLSNIMQFIRVVEAEIKLNGSQALETTLPFAEDQVITSNMDYLIRSLELTSIEVKEASEQDLKQIKGQPPTPGKPSLIIS
ncbi:leucyl-tRNA synthetase [Cavenderia fasciculata]|uniref:leucine--tRNA ligase n=1 Tax=Cavenderia fasciculata TaxID=261658 RepID=F4QF64_CACFS|nr:leucyl-tRNA synthetase [Cavenderia fasciculata]EGG14218.1 leucyl-tRNA synthetase [Cavenderia fasciculata]|eukprot:XP_004350926.1 leucyl-tRNA synthetase [Cavenderia fasciculata]